jgi:1-aminocyclopropane-1-carboxylate deaminase
MRGDFTVATSRLSDITSHRVDVLRLDLIHPVTGGNKYYKLKYNLAEAIRSGHGTICTFGGPFSNHIAATAQACSEAGLKSIGVIRGEISNNSATVDFARENGMKLVFVDREGYSRKNEKSFIGNLHREYGDFYLIPEGGNNAEGVKGASEILSNAGDFYYIFCACGTGTTYAGILTSV